MDRQNDFYRQVDSTQREQRKKERKEKWAKREKSFWKAFLFTEDGKPKSGLLTYTFCLSIIYLALYIVAFGFVTDLQEKHLGGLPPIAGNLLLSVLVGAVGCLAALLIYKLFSDKRLAFGTHLWLVFYLAASVLILCILLKWEWPVISAMLTFALWFAAIPIGMGLVVSYLLFRYGREQEGAAAEEEPEWKKYIRRQ